MTTRSLGDLETGLEVVLGQQVKVFWLDNGIACGVAGRATRYAMTGMDEEQLTLLIEEPHAEIPVEAITDMFVRGFDEEGTPQWDIVYAA